MENNIKLWDSVKRPPETALKKIQGGRLKGMTDISPMWRYRVLTEQLGPIGFGWKYEVVKTWTQQTGNEVLAFADILLYVNNADRWSEPIPGNGGSKMVAQEKNGLHNSDECFKMAITDALSTAMKMIGVGADIYAGCFDGSKYTNKSIDTHIPMMTTAQAQFIFDRCKEEGINSKEFTDAFGISSKESTEIDAKRFIETIDSKIKQFIGEPPEDK